MCRREKGRLALASSWCLKWRRFQNQFDAGLRGRWEQIKSGVGDCFLTNEFGNNFAGFDGAEFRSVEGFGDAACGFLRGGVAFCIAAGLAQANGNGADTGSFGFAGKGKHCRTRGTDILRHGLWRATKTRSGNAAISSACFRFLIRFTKLVHLPKRRVTPPPPCTLIVWPLTHPLAGEHSHNMVLAISSGRPARPVRLSGWRSFSCISSSMPAEP